MADEEVLGLGETDLLASTSSSSMPINVTCIFFNSSTDMSTCSSNNMTEGEEEVVYPYKVRFTGRFVQPHHLAGATLRNYAEILAAAIPFHSLSPGLN